VHRPRPLILHCVSHLALGGAERVALTLIEALRGDFDFCVYAVRGLGDGPMGQALAAELREQNIPLFMGPKIPMRFGGMITGALGLGRTLRRLTPDLVHLHTEIPEASYAALLSADSRWRTTPVIRTIHNAVFWAFWPALGRWCDRRLARAMVAGVSAGAVQAFHRLRAASGAPPPPEAPVLIYNGLAQRDHERPRVHTAGTPVRIVFGGRLEVQKGADLLPAILAQTRLAPGHTAELTIYGSGSSENALRRWSQQPSTGWTVNVQSPVPDFRARLAAYDLVILPSRFEGLPLIAVEAAMAGRPIVGTDAPGLIEALPRNHPWIATAGDAASFAAKLSDAIAATDRWDDVAESARSFANERFALGTMANAYRALYGRGLSRRGAPSSAVASSEHRTRP
jgi:glycosyltransferase involved in cell wall biosynthesis